MIHQALAPVSLDPDIRELDDFRVLLDLALQQRRGYHRACVAIAAKNARVAWALLAKEAAAT